MQSSDHSRAQRHLDWLAEIYRTYSAELQRYIYSKVGEQAQAEDLTSSVFLKALRWLHEDQSRERVRGWLYATARTTIIDYWQEQGQHEARSLAALEEQFPAYTQNEELIRLRAELRVQHLLSLLPERERDVLRLRYLQGYSAAEIARVLGTSPGNIRVLQLRALRRAAQLENQERKIYQMQETPFDAVRRLLSPESSRVLDLSRDEAVRLKHDFIGTEHMLWGLASEGSLSSFFAPLGVTAERIHGGVVFIYDRHVQQLQQMSQGMLTSDTDTFKLLTPRARMVIVLAGEEAKRQGEQSIRPAHLLLGMMNESEGIGAGLLRSLGVSLLQARAMLAPAEAGQICSFCGRSGSQVQRLFPAGASISGATPSSAPASNPTETGASDPTPPSAFICDQCVERFRAMLHSS